MEQTVKNELKNLWENHKTDNYECGAFLYDIITKNHFIELPDSIEYVDKIIKGKLWEKAKNDAKSDLKQSADLPTLYYKTYLLTEFIKKLQNKGWEYKWLTEHEYLVINFFYKFNK